MDNNISTEQIYKAIAIELMEEMARGKDIKTLNSRDKISEILNKIKEKGYYMVHQDLNNANEAAMSNFNQNKDMIFKTLLKKVEKEIGFSVELYKYGKTFNGLRKRWALINDEGIFSLADKSKKINAKNKTYTLENCKINLEKKTNQLQHQWAEPKKEHRIIIEFENIKKKNKKDNIHLYFENEKQLNECRDKLFSIRSMKNENLIINNLKSMQKMIEGSYLFYGVFKLIETKRRIKSRKILLNSMKVNITQSFEPLNKYIRLNLANWVNKYKITKSTYSGSKKSTYFPKWKILHSNFPQKNNEIENKQFVSVNTLKNKVNFIAKNFPEFFGAKKSNDTLLRKSSDMSNIQILGSLKKFIGFKIQTSDYQQNSNQKASNSSWLTNFDVEKFKKIYCFTLNKNTMEINFSENCSLTREDILNISNLFVNLDMTNENNQNYLIVNGPKIDSKKFMKFKYKSSYLPELANEKFVEPEMQALTMNQSNGKNFRTLFIQIFHSIYKFGMNVAEYFEVENRDNKNGDFKFDNPKEDFLFFLSITINKNYKLRTKLVKATKYEKNNFIIEFNLQHILNLDTLNSFNPFELKVSLNLIPAMCFLPNQTEQEKNFFVDYLKPFEMGFCIVNEEKINEKVYEFAFIKEGINLPDENKILMNFSVSDNCSMKTDQSKFYGKEINIGNEIYALEELNKEFFKTRMADNTIDIETKNKIYDVKISNDGMFVLRPPTTENELRCIKLSTDEEFYDKITIESKISANDLKFSVSNKNFNFLPHCEKYYDRKTLENSKNFSLYTNDIIDSYPQVGEWIYKLPAIKKYFLVNFKGMTENRNFVYHNKFTNEIKINKISNPFYDIKRKFKPVQENLFSIYDFIEIDKSTLENVSNYHWRIGFKFMNKNEMNSFIFFLKDIRRRANLYEKREKMIISNPIDIQILSEMTKNVKNTLKCLKILPVQIEFRQNYILNEDKQIMIKLSKANAYDQSVQQGKYMLEALDEDEATGFKNSLVDNLEIKNDIKLLKNMKNDSKTLPKGFEIKADNLNDSSKVVKFGDKIDWNGKLLEIESKPGVDKTFTINISLKGVKSEQILFSNLNLDSIINFRPQAELMYAPLTLEGTNNICGIIFLKIWAVNPGNYQNFEDIFNKNIEESHKKLIDEYGNYVSLGKYDPNVYRRGVLRIIHSHMKNDINTIITKLDNEKTRHDLHQILSKKSIKNSDDLLLENYKSTDNHRWKDLVPDLNLRHSKIFKKFYMNKKRNDFYQIFAICEWEQFFKNYLSNNKSDLYQNDLKKIFSQLPSKTDLINWKNNKNDNYFQLRNLFYFGLPVEVRPIVWDGILNIKELVNLTKMKMINLKLEKGLDDKILIYNHYQQQTKDPLIYNNNFSLIDIDLNYIFPISENKDLNPIKDIAKSFFLWSDLNITTDKYVIGPSNQTKKFVYFFGILKIIQRIESVLKDPVSTFWIIVGLSQIIDLFYQCDPLFNAELSYTKMYVLITNLLIQTHLKNLYNKFVELSFPTEYFFVKLIPSLFSDLFQTELFLRLLDIIIFEASLKTNEFDKIDYLRVICTIPYTLIKLNEKKVMECKSVKEMERVFDDFVRKSFNNQKFIEHVRENLEKFYEMKNFMEIFLEINQDTSWDIRRARVENKLKDTFYNTIKENNNYLKKFKDSKVSLGNNFISNYQNILNEKLLSIRKVYSMGTPDENETNEPKHGLTFCITNFYSFDERVEVSISRPNQLYAYYEFSNQKINYREFNFKIKSPSTTVQFNHSDIEYGLNVSSTNISNKTFASHIPKYMNIFFTDINKNSIIGQYFLDVRNLDLMRPYKIRLESTSEEINKSEIEICIFKYNLENIKDITTNIFNFLFAQPAYIYDAKLETELNGHSVLTLNQIMTAGRILAAGKDILKKFSEQGFSKFITEEYKKNTLGSNSRIKINSPTENISKPVEEILESVFENNQNSTDPKPIIIDWLKNTESSFEELLYAIILVDSSSVTLHEKLKLIFDVGRMKNYTIHNSDCITVDKLKELIYCLYKRFTVYFPRSDVDRLVDYILKRDSFTNFKWGLFYNDKNSHKVEEVVFDNDHVSTSITSFVLRDKFFIDVKRNFILLTNILKNQFGLKTIPIELITSLSDYITNTHDIKFDINKLRFDIDTDNIRKVKILNVVKNNNKTISISDNKTNINGRFNSEESLWGNIITNEINTIDETNTYVNNNIEVSYDKFKDVFFNLPYISDLMRASCGFNSLDNKEHVVKTFQNVKVEISYLERERRPVRNFIFTENFDPSSYRSSNIKATNFNMNRNLISTMSIQDIVELIKEKLTERPEIYEEIQTFLDNPNLISFYVVNKEIRIEEKIKFFDPLFSNSYVRNNNSLSQIDIIFKLESSEEITRIDNKIVPAQNGFAKFKNANISAYNEWRECRIKENKIKYKSFDHQYYFKAPFEEVIFDEMI